MDNTGYAFLESTSEISPTAPQKSETEEAKYLPLNLPSHAPSYLGITDRIGKCLPMQATIQALPLIGDFVAASGTHIRNGRSTRRLA